MIKPDLQNRFALQTLDLFFLSFDANTHLTSMAIACVWHGNGAEVWIQRGFSQSRAAMAKHLPPKASTPAPSSYCDRECTLEGWRRPLGGTVANAYSYPIVALGKFDALHLGHRSLATAAAGLGGAPWLVSFAGMAEVLGWPSRLPLVAPCDRRRIMRSWAMVCNGRIPTECAIPFHEVRIMPPESFVALLAHELKVSGVVVGSNYRFGYKASGTAELLRSLGPKYGIKVGVVDLVVGAQTTSSLDDEGDDAIAGRETYATSIVSSSRVRHALAEGKMDDVARCLGRPHRLVANAVLGEESNGNLVINASEFDNQPPGPGWYTARVQFAFDGPEMPPEGQGELLKVRLENGGLEIADDRKGTLGKAIKVAAQLRSEDRKQLKALLDFVDIR
jgi:FAD synthetase